MGITTLTHVTYCETRPKFCFGGILGYHSDAVDKFYVRARYYRLTLARWQAVDPLWPGESAYGFVNGRPVALVDRLGLHPEYADACEKARNDCWAAVERQVAPCGAPCDKAYGAAKKLCSLLPELERVACFAAATAAYVACWRICLDLGKGGYAACELAYEACKARQNAVFAVITICLLAILLILVCIVFPEFCLVVAPPLIPAPILALRQ